MGRQRPVHVAPRPQGHAETEQGLGVVGVDGERGAVLRLGLVVPLQGQFGVGQSAAHRDVRPRFRREGREQIHRPLRPARQIIEERQIELHPEIVRRRAGDPAFQRRDRARHVALLAEHQTHALVGVPVRGVDLERAREIQPRRRPVVLGQTHVAELGPGSGAGRLDLHGPLQSRRRARQIALHGQDHAEDLVAGRQIGRAGENRARQRAGGLRVALLDERERPAQIRLVRVHLLDAADRHGEDRRGGRQDQSRGEQDRDQAER